MHTQVLQNCLLTMRGPRVKKKSFFSVFFFYFIIVELGETKLYRPCFFVPLHWGLKSSSTLRPHSCASVYINKRISSLSEIRELKVHRPMPPQFSFSLLRRGREQGRMRTWGESIPNVHKKKARKKKEWFIAISAHETSPNKTAKLYSLLKLVGPV